MNDGVEIERDETSDECNTMLRVSESRVDMTQRRFTRHNDEAKYKTRKCHFANLLSHRSVKDSFNRKLTTIVLMGREMRGETRRQTELSKQRVKPLRDALYRGKSRGVGLIISQTY